MASNTINLNTYKTITSENLSEYQSNKADIRAWVNTNANIHRSQQQGDFIVRRFFTQDQSTPAAYNLPVVDTHNLIFSIDSGVAYNRILTFDIRSTKIFTTGKLNNSWENWRGIVTSAPNTAVGSTSVPVFIDVNHEAQPITSYAGTAAQATRLSSTGTTGQFWRGDNTWSNTLTTPTILQLGYYAHIANASGGSAGYFNFATIKINQAYVNKCIKINHVGRGRPGGVIYIWVENSSNSDPSLNVRYEGSPAVYYYKSATSTWQLYISKEENYASDMFTIINPGAVGDGGITLTWQNISVASLPAGYATAAVHTKDLHITGTASRLTNITTSDAAASSGTQRYVFISYDDRTTNRPAYDTALTFQTNTKTLFAGRCLDLRGDTTNTMSNATTNPRIRFSEWGDQAVYLAYTDFDSYRPSKGLKVVDADGSDAGNVWFEVQGHIYSAAVHNAVWNDVAECRKATSDAREPGYAIAPSDNGISSKTDRRMQAGARIVSDTWGMILGESTEQKAPVGIAGRVLAYPYRNRKEYKVGDAVCSAPGGTIDVMTRKEIMMYPDRIIGIVNEIPDYEVWEERSPEEGGAAVRIEVRGRIWIDIK